VVLKGDNWYSEYKRLYYHAPTQLSERFEGHTDEVLDVTFSHDGTVFCTTSKDATVKVCMNICVMFSLFYNSHMYMYLGNLPETFPVTN